MIKPAPIYKWSLTIVTPPNMAVRTEIQTIACATFDIFMMSTQNRVGHDLYFFVVNVSVKKREQSTSFMFLRYSCLGKRHPSGCRAGDNIIHSQNQKWMFFDERSDHRSSEVLSDSFLSTLRLKPLPDERERSNICHRIFSFVITHSLFGNRYTSNSRSRSLRI